MVCSIQRMNYSLAELESEYKILLLSFLNDKTPVEDENKVPLFSMARKKLSKPKFKLRIPDIHGTKTHKNQTPLARLPQ